MTLWPPRVPSEQEPLWRLEPTHAYMMTDDPAALWMHIVVHCHRQGAYGVVCHKPYRMKLEAGQFMAVMRLFDASDGTTGLCVAELQKRDGCAMNFYAAWDNFRKCFAQPID